MVRKLLGKLCSYYGLITLIFVFDLALLFMNILAYKLLIRNGFLYNKSVTLLYIRPFIIEFTCIVSFLVMVYRKWDEESIKVHRLIRMATIPNHSILMVAYMLID